MQYKTGTVSVTNGSKIVTGSGTAFLTNGVPIANGDQLTILGELTYYQVGTADSDGQITLVENYGGTTGTGKQYYILRDFTSLGIPILQRGDIDVAGIFARLARKVDQILIATSALPIPLLATDGGTGATSLTNHGILIGSGGSPVQALAVFAVGSLLLGAGAANPTELMIGGVGKILTSDGTTASWQPFSGATLASPAFTGTPTAPTAAVDTNTTQLATTAFILAQAASATPLINGTAAAGTSTRWAHGDHVHPTDTTRAALASPTFTGSPAAPTPTTADNSTLLATTAFVKAQSYLTANQSITVTGDGTGSGTTAITLTLATVATPGTYKSVTVNAKGLVTAGTNPTTLAGYGITDAVNTSTLGANSGVATLDGSGKLTTSQIPPALLGGLTVQGTWNATTNSPTLVSSTGTKGFYYVVSTAGTTTIDGISSWNAGDWIVFNGTVWNKVDGISNEVVSVAGRTGAVTLAVADVSGAAPLASPTFTGTPSAPTAAVDTNTTQAATTAFVLAQAASATPIINGTAAAGTSTRFARGDHVHPTDTTRAGLASPTFTGTPVLSTATATSINKVAITAPATGSTLTIADGKTLTVSNTLTIAGTDTSTLNIGAGGTLGTGAFAATYSLATATASVLGGVKPDGTTIANASGVISLGLGNANTWTALQTFNDGEFALAGLTSGTLTLKATAVTGTQVITFPAATDTVAVLGATSQVFSGGLHITGFSIGTVTSGTTTIDFGNSPIQYMTNNGASTIAAPGADGNCILMITNGASAGALTFSGFTVSSSVGDAFTTTNTNKFMVSMIRINGTSTYMVKALQ